MVCRVKSCCLFLSLRIGTIIIGCFWIFAVITQIVGMAVRNEQQTSVGWTAFTGTIAALSLLTSVLLLSGVHTRNPKYLVPWLVVQLVAIIETTIEILNYIVRSAEVSILAEDVDEGTLMLTGVKTTDARKTVIKVIATGALAIAASVALQHYCISVVFSYRAQLEEDKALARGRMHEFANPLAPTVGNSESG